MWTVFRGASVRNYPLQKPLYVGRHIARLLRTGPRFCRKPAIKAYQASRRGGYLYLELLDNERIKISGEAVLVAVADIKTNF